MSNSATALISPASPVANDAAHQVAELRVLRLPCCKAGAHHVLPNGSHGPLENGLFDHRMLRSCEPLHGFRHVFRCGLQHHLPKLGGRVRAIFRTEAHPCRSEVFVEVLPTTHRQPLDRQGQRNAIRTPHDRCHASLGMGHGSARSSSNAVRAMMGCGSATGPLAMARQHAWWYGPGAHGANALRQASRTIACRPFQQERVRQWAELAHP